MNFKQCCFFIFSILLIFPFSVFALEDDYLSVKIFDSSTKKLETEFQLPSNYTEGINITAGDVDGDFQDEIIVGSGYGQRSRVGIFSLTGRLQSEFMAYNENFLGGVSVAACDLDGNGKEEIITGAGLGGGPHVRIFDETGLPVVSNGFFAFSKDYNKGIRVACGDVNVNRLNEIIVSTDYELMPKVRVFDRNGRIIGDGFSAKNINGYMGTNLALVDFFGDGNAKIALTVRYGEMPAVKIYNVQGLLVRDFLAYAKEFKGGVSMHAYQDAKKRYLLTGAGIGGGPHFRMMDFDGNVIKEFFPLPIGFRGGIEVASGNVDNDPDTELIVVEQRVHQEELYKLAKKTVDVDLSEQTLRVYDNGYLVHAFLISSGKKGFDTPLGEYTIWRKRPKVRMSWYYGPSSPHNYNLPNVPWVLSFLGPYTIHGTYWHNNFGTPMSHGCVNMSIPDAKWMYEWGEIGTKVKIKE